MGRWSLCSLLDAPGSLGHYRLSSSHNVTKSSSEVRARRLRLQNFGTLFRGDGRIPADPYVYLTTERLMRGLTAYLSPTTFEEIAEDVACHIFEFTDLKWLRINQLPNGEDFLATTIPCLRKGSLLDLSGIPFGYQGLPNELQCPVRIRPLVGLNVLAISAEGGEFDRFFLLWTHTSNQRTDVAVLILDLAEQTAYLQSSNARMAFADLYTIMKFSVPQAMWARAQARADWLRSLVVAEQLALVPLPCPTHFGHYVQNNLCHLSRLEELGVTGHCSSVYRPGPYDYFSEEEEKAFFMQDTQSLVEVVPSFEAAKVLAGKRSQALIASKGATLSGHLARCLQSSLTPQANEVTEWGGDTEIYRLCVGVRGGSREAINLVEVIDQVIRGLLDRQHNPVHLVVDGMSQSLLNSKDTTRFLSLEREEQLALALAGLQQQLPRLSVESVVNKPMFVQMEAIARCNATISHFGSSFFKYMVMAGRPVIVHGDRPAFADKYAETPPPNYFLGPDYILRFGAGPDPKRACYELDTQKITPALLDILLRY
jgi:hypothetical protein